MLKKLLLTSCVVIGLHFGTVAQAAKQQPASLHSSATYSISPGLAFFGNVVGPSVNSYVGFAPIQGHDFYVGGDLGIAFFFPSAFVMDISLLPSAWYQFRLPANNKISLVAGVSFGPSIIVGSGGGVTAAGVTYEFLFRPGFLMETSDGMLMGADLKFGVIGGTFIFKPQFNIVFAL